MYKPKPKPPHTGYLPPMKSHYGAVNSSTSHYYNQRPSVSKYGATLNNNHNRPSNFGRFTNTQQQPTRSQNISLTFPSTSSYVSYLPPSNQQFSFSNSPNTHASNTRYQHHYDFDDDDDDIPLAAYPASPAAPVRYNSHRNQQKTRHQPIASASSSSRHYGGPPQKSLIWWRK